MAAGIWDVMSHSFGQYSEHAHRSFLWNSVTYDQTDILTPKTEYSFHRAMYILLPVFYKEV
jgi:hypothetical protein